MINLNKIKIEIRVCLACKRIFGCHLFGHRMKCEDCFITQCELRKVDTVDKKFVDLLESRMMSITSGFCQKCFNGRKELRKKEKII